MAGPEVGAAAGNGSLTGRERRRGAALGRRKREPGSSPMRRRSRTVVGMRVLLVSDTHVARRAKAVPEQVLVEAAVADVVIHAGDWVDVDVLDLFEASAHRVVGVYGNNDGADLRARLPEVARVELGGVRFAVVHETGPAEGRERRCAARYPDADVLVFGHSHIPWDTVADTGLRLLNPGSPTDRRRQPHHTYMTLTAEAGRISDVVLHNLD